MVYWFVQSRVSEGEVKRDECRSPPRSGIHRGAGIEGQEQETDAAESQARCRSGAPCPQVVSFLGWRLFRKRFVEKERQACPSRRLSVASG